VTKSFPKTRRVQHSREFTSILRRGTCVADGVLVLFATALENGQPSRIGITIPKKTGNAVARNRWKRLVRESFRTQQESIPSGYSFVVRPKKGASPSWAAIRKSVPYLAKKAAKRMAKPQ
tara:strand:+ start:148816 stop:149175 length:360 start_codon:yes stop_codon:yes gene_type:complete